MRELALEAPGMVGWSEAVEPALQSNQAALVRPLVAATCDFDHLLVLGSCAAGLPCRDGARGRRGRPRSR